MLWLRSTHCETQGGLTDYDVTGKNKQDLVEEILVERRRELWGEGFSMTDILRTQNPWNVKC